MKLGTRFSIVAIPSAIVCFVLDAPLCGALCLFWAGFFFNRNLK